MDPIDLTISSPEPEDVPDISLHREPAFKQERQFPQGHASVKRESKQSTPHHRGFAQQPRHIDPKHLALIVNSSSEHALREVLLDLCRISPALSGAVVRGLAPHSDFARGLMRKYQPVTPYATPLPKLKSEIKSRTPWPTYRQSESAAQRPLQGYNPSQQSIYSSGSSKDSGVSKTPLRSPMYRDHRGDPHSSDSDQEFDVDLKAVKTFRPVPSSARRATPYQTPAKPSYTVKSEPLASGSRLRYTQLGITQSSPRVQVEKVCSKCHDRYEDEDETCFYHPKEHTIVEGVIVCKNCNAPIDDLGCKLGLHESQSS